MTADRGRGVRDDQREPDRPVAVADHEVQEGRPEHDREDHDRVPSASDQRERADHDQHGRARIERPPERLVLLRREVRPITPKIASPTARAMSNTTPDRVRSGSVTDFIVGSSSASTVAA